MPAKTKDMGIPPELEADTQAVLERLMTGQSLPPQTARRIHERAEKIRQDVLQKHGVLDIGVPAIRELRGELPNP
ncbi:MAG: hypothetical protein JNM56_20615 [Planctomycetia bacterium]|nr:hypothetical protein [Planctomycetia bacterium]